MIDPDSSIKQNIDQILAGATSSSNPDDAIQGNIQAVLSGTYQEPSQKVLPMSAEVTQRFGNYNPGLEVFSGGRALDTNFAAPESTPVSTPPGEWYVASAYNQASPQGYVGDSTNQGYGNDAILENTKTGEKLRYLHLKDVHVQPGQIVSGGIPVGTVGQSGNATGPNLGVEYYGANGQMDDVLNSPYGHYFQ